MNKKDYQLLIDSYYGSGGYLDGSYLETSTAEDANKLEFRKRNASCPRFTKLAIDANLNPVINDVERDAENDLIDAFMKDCDGFGGDYADFITECARKADIFSYVIVLFSSPEREAITKADLYNDNKIYSLVFASGYDENDNQIYSHYQLTKEGGIFWQDTDSRIDSNSMGAMPVIAEPFIFTFSSAKNRLSLPEPEYLSTAIAQKSYYNLQSLKVYQAFKTTFSFLTYNGDFQSGALGENSVLNYPMGNNAPAFITPDDTMKVLEESAMEPLKRDCFTEVNLGILYAGENISGESKKWSDLIRQQNLMRKSNLIAKYDNLIISKIADYLGVDAGYQCTYPSSFESLTMDQDLKEAREYIELGIAPENEVRIKERIGVQMFADASKEEKQEIKNAEARNIDYEQVTDDEDNI